MLPEKIHRHPDVAGRVIADLALDGQETVETDPVQRLQISREINLALTERHFPESFAFLNHIFNHTINDLRILDQQSDAVLGVGMHDIGAEQFDGGNRVVAP